MLPLPQRRAKIRAQSFADRVVPDAIPTIPSPNWRPQGQEVEASAPAGHADDAPKPLTVSIVISTLDRAQHLSQLLLALRHLRYPSFEVVIVEGPSSDGSAGVVDRFGPSVRRLACPVRNLSVSRNIGLRAAGGDLVAFIDDDAIPEPDWLDRLTAPFADPKVVATGGAIRNWTGLRFQCRALTVDNAARVRKSTVEVLRKEAVCPAFTGTNFCVRRDAAFGAGLFDESFRYLMEESDLQRVFFEAGGKLVYVDDAQVHHLLAKNEHRDRRRVPTDFTQRLASLTYFCLKHRDDQDTREDIVERVSHHLEASFRRIARARAAGKIDAANARALIQSACRGVRAGLKLAAAAVVRSAPSVSAGPSDAFQRFVTDRRFPVIAMLARGRIEDVDGDALDGLAAALAGHGADVTLVLPHATSSVAFTGTHWRHRLASRWWADKIRGLTWRRAVMELRRVQMHRAFDVVLDIHMRRVGIVVVVRTWGGKMSQRGAMRMVRPNSVVRLAGPEAVRDLVADPAWVLAACAAHAPRANRQA